MPDIDYFNPEIHDPEQRWFWTFDWQYDEAKVERDINLGNIETFETMEEFLESLKDVEP